MTSDEALQELLDQGQLHPKDRFIIKAALDVVANPLQNQIIHLQVQLRQAQQALEAAKTEHFNAGVENAAQLIEANEQWFEGPNDHIRFAEEIRDLKE
jgi:hypothetical protein